MFQAGKKCPAICSLSTTGYSWVENCAYLNMKFQWPILSASGRCCCKHRFTCVSGQDCRQRLVCFLQIVPQLRACCHPACCPFENDLDFGCTQGGHIRPQHCLEHPAF